MAVRVLIVDDDALLLAGMTRLLAQFAVTTAGTTEKAIGLALAQPFDAVLTDFRVPPTDGLTLLRKMSEVVPTARRYLMSGTPPEQFAEHVKAGLLHRVFVKPLDVTALRSEIAALGTASPAR